MGKKVSILQYLEKYDVYDRQNNGELMASVQLYDDLIKVNRSSKYFRIRLNLVWNFLNKIIGSNPSYDYETFEKFIRSLRSGTLGYFITNFSQDGDFLHSFSINKEIDEIKAQYRFLIKQEKVDKKNFSPDKALIFYNALAKIRDDINQILGDKND